MAIISIKYKEGKHKSWKAYGYKYVEFSYSFNKKIVKFKTGNFIKDWYELNKYLTQNDINEPVMHSSSVDHFIMDGAPFDSAYLHMVDDKPILKYLDRTDENWWKSDVANGIEFFVPEGTTPTWEELEELNKTNEI